VEKRNHWNLEARNLLRAELARRHVTYKELALRLPTVGLNETEASITQKMARGKFQLAFFLQCMWVIGSRNLHIEVSAPDSVTAEGAIKVEADAALAQTSRMR
jgi:Domain of unknown function (DUF6471)